MREDAHISGEERPVGLMRVNELPSPVNNVAAGAPPSESKAFATCGKGRWILSSVYSIVIIITANTSMAVMYQIVF